jgi:hypothetical protein
MATTLSSPWSKLTGAQQTMSSWAQVIESYDAVPAAYREECRKILGDRSVFPYVVFAPTIAGLEHKSVDHLLCDVDDTFYILERAGNQVVTTGYPWKTIHDFELGIILLYSWLTLCGETKERTTAVSTVAFNTATLRHLTPFLDKMRPAPTGTDEMELVAERAKLNYLGAVNYKFMNYARESLVHGEQVIQAVWQPEIRTRQANLFGLPLYRTRSMAHLTLLTNKEIILIRDDERSRENRGIRYGGVWQYIPLHHVVSVSLAEPTPEFLTCSLHLSSGARHDRVFATARRRELETLIVEIERFSAWIQGLTKSYRTLTIA